jgi:hypothetical protein
VTFRFSSLFSSCCAWLNSLQSQVSDMSCGGWEIMIKLRATERNFHRAIISCQRKQRWCIHARAYCNFNVNHNNRPCVYIEKSSQVNEKSIKTTTTTMQLAVCDKQLFHKIIIPSRFKNTLLFAFSHMYLVTGVCMCAWKYYHVSVIKRKKERSTTTMTMANWQKNNTSLHAHTCLCFFRQCSCWMCSLTV